MGKVIDGGFYESEDEIPEPVSFIMGGNLASYQPRQYSERHVAREEWLDKVEEEKGFDYVMDNLQALCQQWEAEHPMA
jgi:hypothetical protein